MTDVTSGRGSQSGGVASFLSPSSRGVRARVRPGRRQNISALLVRELRSKLRLRGLLARLTTALSQPAGAAASPSPLAAAASARAPSLVAAPVLLQGHTRFATSSLPSVSESHPHKWSPDTATVEHWRVDLGSGAAVLSNAHPFDLFITHSATLAPPWSFLVRLACAGERTLHELIEDIMLYIYAPDLLQLRDTTANASR